MATERAFDRQIEVPSKLVDRLTTQLAPASIHHLQELPQAAIQVVTELEEAAQAFLFLEPLSWMGVVRQPSYEDLRPETPKAVKVAVEKIGSIALYWNAYATEVRNGRLGIAPDTERDVLEIDSARRVRIVQSPSRTAEEAIKHDRTDRQYGGYIIRSNWIGDGDFWGIARPSIFPMRVKVTGSTYDNTAQFASVSRETLGIPQELEHKTWHSWRGLFSHLEILHRESVIELCKRQAFPPVLQQEIARALVNGEDLSRPYQIALLALKKHGIQAEEIDTAITDSVALIGKQITDKVCRGNSNANLAEASDELATNLNHMWELAKSSQIRK